MNVCKIITCFYLKFISFLLILAVVQGQARKKYFKAGKEYVYKSEIRVGTGTMDYAPHLVGGVYRMKTRVQVQNDRQLNVEVGFGDLSNRLL